MSFSLPVFSANERCDTALATLREVEKAAIVVDDGEALSLVFAGDLARAEQDGTTLLRDIPDPVPLAEPAAAEAGLGLGDIELAVPPMPTAEGAGVYKSVFRPRVQAFTAVRTATGAQVFAATETDAAMLRLPGPLRCNGPTTHYFPRPPVALGSYCPLCVTPPGKPLPIVGV